jgi:hypothetical protein
MLLLNTVVNKLVFLPCDLGFNCPNLDVIIPDVLRRKYLDSTLKYVTTTSSELLLKLQFNNRLTHHAIAVMNFGSAFKKMRKKYAYRFEIPYPYICKYNFFSIFRSRLAQNSVLQ